LIAIPAWCTELASSGLVNRLEKIRVEHETPAFAIVLVDRSGTLVADSRGIADLASGRRVDERTRFRIGSITKTFVALGVLRAQRAGLLRVVDPVTKWLPELPYDNPYAPEIPVRIDQLLEHTAGFQDWVKDEWDLNDPLSLKQALAYRPDSRRVRWPPGWHMSYTNNGAGIVAAVLESATGESLEAFLEEAVFAPLEMHTARLIPDDETFELLATGYDSDGRTVIPYWHVIFRASAALSLHPVDMAPALRMFLDRGMTPGGRFLDEAAIRRMERVETTIAARSGLGYGYGLGLRQWQTEGHSFFGHGGDGDGYLAHFGYCPEAGLGYLVVINAFTHEPLREMRDAIESHIVAALPTAPRQAVVTHDTDEMMAVTGRYETASRRFPGDENPDVVDVLVRDGGLFTRQDGRLRPLIHVGGGQYRRPWQSVATMALVPGPDGRLYLQGPIGSYVRVEGSAAVPEP
jgi:CubicO group peptidase (beta-lactamase class C family)